MLFTKSFVILTDHTIDSPLVDTIEIAHGVITRVSVFFPRGCHGLVYCKLQHHGTTVFPSQENMYLMSDGYPIEWDEYYESYQPPYLLKFVGWSYGTTYAHVITVRIAILPRKAILALATVDAIKGLVSSLSPKRIFTGKSKEVK